MAYTELFDQVAAYVRDLGVKVRIKHGRPISAVRIDKTYGNTLVHVPYSIRDFYSEMGDGFYFGWETSGDYAPSANIEFPKLSELIADNLDKRTYRTEWKEDYHFRFIDDPAEGKKMALRMRYWVGFQTAGSGTRFCVDPSIKGEPVVFSPVSWMDGMASFQDNSHIMGKSLLDFYQRWSTVCFQDPQSGWWPSVFRKGSSVKWRSDEFRVPFRLR